ncbi:hypothetical protein B0H14DRAFT_2890821 [Mycena olivaceomarginata]|nr:hypothetical protein B0H14DRAFT_2890821 [Mycena olivaceomarginata]
MPRYHGEPSGVLFSVAGEIAFFRAVTKARPIGLHRHFHVLNIRESIHDDTGNLLSIEEIWAKLGALWDLEKLESKENCSADPPSFHHEYEPPSSIAELIAQRQTNAEGETEVARFNGHRWAGRNLMFQVVFMDGDVTWEPLSNVEDCAAMDSYLAHCKVTNPLRLPKRQLINTALKATNED